MHLLGGRPIVLLFSFLCPTSLSPTCLTLKTPNFLCVFSMVAYNMHTLTYPESLSGGRFLP